MAAETIKPEQISKHKRKRVGKTKTRQIKAMKVAGMTERDITTVSGIPKTTVHQIIHREFTPEELKSFQEQESMILADKRAMILNSIDQDEINAAPLRDKAVTYGIFTEKALLLDGKATSHVIMLHADIAALKGKSQAVDV